MSQSAENQSAIIENENNSNIFMESQAALNSGLEALNNEDVVGPDTPTQDESVESMEVEEGGSWRPPEVGGEGQELVTSEGEGYQDPAVMESCLEQEGMPVDGGGESVPPPPDDQVGNAEPVLSGTEPAESGESLKQDEIEQTMDVEETEWEAQDPAEVAEAGDVHEDEEPECLDDREAIENTEMAAELESVQEEAKDFVDAEVEEGENAAESLEPEVSAAILEGEKSDEHDVPEFAEADTAAIDAGSATFQDVQDDLADIAEQRGDALAQDQAEDVENVVSAEDEDRLLADGNTESQDGADGFLASAEELPEGGTVADQLESVEELSEAAPGLSEDIAEAREEDVQEVEQFEGVTETTEDVSENLDDVSQAVVPAPSDNQEAVEEVFDTERADDGENAEKDLVGVDEFATSTHSTNEEKTDANEGHVSDEPGDESVSTSKGMERVHSVNGYLAECSEKQDCDSTMQALETEGDQATASTGEDGTLVAEAQNADSDDVAVVERATADDTSQAAEEIKDTDKLTVEGESRSEGEVPAVDGESEQTDNATLETGNADEDGPVCQVPGVKSDESGGREVVEEQDQLELKEKSKDESMEVEEIKEEKQSTDNAESVDVKVEAGTVKTEKDDNAPSSEPVKIDDDDDDDVVVLDDVEEIPSMKKEATEKELFNSSNDMGIQIESVSGGADELHEAATKRENGVDRRHNSTAGSKESQGSAMTTRKSAKLQNCIVCKKVGKCKYNIVRNGDVKHLCDDDCFKRFRANPTVFLKSSGAIPSPPTDKKVKQPVKLPGRPLKAKPNTPSYKTCVVCQLMNINTQGQFCMWKGLDFCGEGCLGKFQAGISTSCTLCTAFIPVAARSANCLRLGSEVRPFCSPRCFADYKLRMRLCTFCQRDLKSTTDSFSAPVGTEGSFKDFCSQSCMKKYEDMLNTDIEIIRVEPGKQRPVNKCSVCQKSETTKHSVKYNGVIANLCSDPCLSAFQYANKLDMSSCDFCGSLCTSIESSPHTVQFEGHQKSFCSDACVTKFRFNHRKMTPCSWCGSQRDNFDMIERLDSNNKYQLFCSLNCLSLYRVNLQAKSNQAVTCDQCLKFTPAQYHLTMSDASVRNFCSYNCVMTFQAQFSKGAPPATPPSTPTPPPQSSTPRHGHNTRGKTTRRNQQAAPAPSPTFPVISNVVSLAPQASGQKVNILSNSGVPVAGKGSPGVKTAPATTSVGTAPVQQQIIIQPPPPKVVKNKSLLCKPIVQTKATSCRPHTQTKECQTDEMKEKPVLVPVPVPVYVPTPMALYSAPVPTPVFIPIPIPVPIFIPTTRKSANGILKQIKEIQEKTPADPLEAEILMMAAAVSADGKNSSDSDTEEEILPVVSRSKKRTLPADDEEVDDDDGDVMPLTSSKDEEGGEEDMISMALRMAEEMSGPITDLESAVEAVPINTEPPQARTTSPDAISHEEDMTMTRSRRATKRGGASRRGAGRPPKRQRMQAAQPEPVPLRQDPVVPAAPPADANCNLKFTYGVNAWRHWVLFKNAQIERNVKPGSGRIKLFKTDIMQCTADELNFSLCLFVKEVRKPNGEEYSPDSIYYLTLGIQQYLFENGRIDNIFTDLYYEKFTECLTELLSKCQPKFNSAGQMVCRIEEEHLWECKQLGAHSPYVLLNTLIYFHTKYFILKTPQDHMKLSFAHILKYWKKGQPGKGGQPTRTVSLRYYSVSTAKKDGSAPTSTTKKGSKEGIPVYEVTENQENPLRCPVKLYEFYLSKCPESIKNRSDIFYPVPERSCVPDSPVWYSTMPINLDIMAKMLTRILLVREIQEAHLHAQPIYV